MLRSVKRIISGCNNSIVYPEGGTLIKPYTRIIDKGVRLHQPKGWPVLWDLQLCIKHPEYQRTILSPEIWFVSVHILTWSDQYSDNCSGRTFSISEPYLPYQRGVLEKCTFASVNLSYNYRGIAVWRGNGRLCNHWFLEHERNSTYRLLRWRNSTPCRTQC